MSLFSIVKSDLQRYAPPGNLLLTFKTIFLSHAFHLVFFIRIGCTVRKIPGLGGFFGALIEYFVRIFFASDISCKAEIGHGLMILHGHDIVIGANSIIGKNCKIFNGVTLGNKDTETPNNEQPTVGDDVVIGTGSKLLGAIIVGDRVKIGANSVVIRSVPANSTIAGVPARIIKNGINYL